MEKQLQQISKNKRRNCTLPVLFTLALMLAGMTGMAQTAYITNYNDTSVSVINVATSTVSATIKVGIEPYCVSVSLDGTKVYVTNVYSRTVSVINTATNTVSATIADGGCIEFGNFISTYKQTTGIASFSIDVASISISPNPATDELFINSNGSLENNILTIYNVVGEIIYSQKINSKEATINCKPFPAGMYFLQLKWENGIVVKRFVKE